jgi:hypothetical protein
MVRSSLLGVCILTLSAALCGSSSRAADPEFTVLEPGLDFGVFSSAEPTLAGAGRIRVLRIDPERFGLRLLMASELAPGARPTAEEWADTHGLLAVINASMFRMDGQTSTFLMRTAGHTNNATLAESPGDVLILDAKPGVKRSARIVDLRCEDWSVLKKSYGSHIQGYRMIGCNRTPLWPRNDKVWSHAVIGQDSAGRILFIHARSPWNTRVFTEILLGLPLDLTRLQYAEGGPEATLYVHVGDFREAHVGSWETGFREDDENQAMWGLPNVVGVVHLPER